MPFRIGIGYDIHKLINGKRLFLGGVEIDFPKGLLGHSDADVLLHAICDALLGACGLGDIGMHFPDTDPGLKGISSLEILKKTHEIINKSKRCEIVNIDTVVICDEPKISRHTSNMKKNIAQALDIDPGRVNIKGKTTEKTSLDVILSYATVLVDIK